MPRVWTPDRSSPAGGGTGLVLWEHWDAIILDIHEQYGVDLDRDARSVSWHWFLSRVEGLLSQPWSEEKPPNRLRWALSKKE